jgi:hypothetical protein
MNHEEATRYLDDLGELVPDRRPPMGDLLHAGQGAERRRARRTLALVAASVALVLGGGALVQQMATGDGAHRDESVADRAPQAPDGMRFVGMGRVVIAVPLAWELNQGCAENADGTNPGFRVQDAAAVGGLSCSSLGAAFYVLDSPEGRRVSRSATVPDVINGLDVLRTPARPCSLSITRYCPESVSVPSENLVLEFRTLDTDFSPVLGSLQLLPDGLTTVPFVARGTMSSSATAIIEASGLSATKRPLDSDVSVRGTDPTAGSVVRSGDPVTLVVAGDGPKPSVPDGTKLVGMKKVVVAVPDSWGTERTKCGQPTHDTVYFNPVGRDCLVEQAGTSSVLILDLDSEEGSDVAAVATTPSEINGIDVLRGPPECPDTAICEVPYEEVVVVPEQGVVLAVPEGGGGAEVLESLQLLPEGYTTVPYIALGTELEDAKSLVRNAGLVADVRGPVNALSTVVVGLVAPVGGTAYSVGGTVTLEVEVVGMGEGQ